MPQWPADKLDWIITLIVEKNPKRLGSQTYHRFRLYPTGIAVREYASCCERDAADHGLQYALNGILWDIERNFIEVNPPKVTGSLAGRA